MGWRNFATSLLSCAVFLGWPGVLSERQPSVSCFRPVYSDKSLYNFTLPDLLETRNVSLSEYTGKLVLVVNVATYWGFTWHYSQLNALKESYNNSGFEVLGIPCNQFGKQEPGGNGEEIMNGIRYVRPGKGFEPNFPIFKKVDINGKQEHPLYDFLKKFCPPTRDEFSDQTKLFYTPIKNRDIRWNFEKILVDRTGMPIMRYDPSTEPKTIAQDIDFVLASEKS